jgi:hypothetical protein
MKRGLLVFLGIMTAETLHGVLRNLLLAPRTGEETGSWVAWFTGMGIVLLISTLSIGWTGLRQPKDLLGLGAVWAVLTAAFELTIGWLRGMGPEELAGAINPLTGTIPYSAAVMLFAPLAAAWLRGLR